MRKPLLLILALLALGLLASAAKATEIGSPDSLIIEPCLSAIGCGCEPFFVCNTVYNSISFVRQKDNGVCVYQCTFTETCTDINQCSGLPPTVTNGSFRVRSDPLPPGACPSAQLTFCDGFVID